MNSYRYRAFTLIELLTVMVVIIVLAAMVLHGVGYAQTRAARSRAEAEIHAISVALENYKIDVGSYPPNTGMSAVSSGVQPSEGVGRFLAAYLCGIDAVKVTDNEKADPTFQMNYAALKKWRGYIALPQSSFSGTGVSTTLPNPNDVGDPNPIVIKLQYLADPFGNPYGFSVAGTYNPTFDLWSTGGDKDNQAKWITNW